MSSPLISVLCVSMNHELYVDQALQSFIEQSYSNIEILYLDNASADKTFDIATALLSKGNRSYQAFKRERSYSLPQNFNFLIEKAKGKYLCFISCDDWMKKEFIEQMVIEYERHPDIGLLYSNGWYYYEDKGNYELAENSRFIAGKIFDHVFLNGVLFPVGVMIKKEVFDKVGLYDESLIIEDYDMWLRIAAEYEIGYSKTPLIYYRKHSKSMTLTGVNKIENYIAIAEKYKTHKLFKRVCRNFRQFTMYRYFLDGDIKKASKMFVQDFHFERFYFSVAYKFYIARLFSKNYKPRH